MGEQDLDEFNLGFVSHVAILALGGIERHLVGAATWGRTDPVCQSRRWLTLYYARHIWAAVDAQDLPAAMTNDPDTLPSKPRRGAGGSDSGHQEIRPQASVGPPAPPKRRLPLAEASLAEPGSRPIRAINQKDNYEAWLESLPFPLARVLWKHYASKRSHRERYETLLHFFEATAAFLATVHLSAFMSDDEVWNECGPQLIERMEKERLSLRQASFGSWKLTFEFLSKRCDEMLTEQGVEGEKPTWQKIFGTTDRRAVQTIADARLRTILQEANKIRNDWHGHSGAIGSAVAKDVHDQLENLVQRTREAFGQRWRSYELIQPDSSRKKSGIHYVTSNRLVGTRCNPFAERVYESEESLESGALYLFDPVARQGLQLLPLVTVMPSPEQAADTCYVLSRVGDKNGPRWVSYHYEPESQINQHVEGISETFERLELRGPALPDLHPTGE